MKERRTRSKAERTVTFTAGDGQLRETKVLAVLLTGERDPRNSFYTLDRNGERIIIKPFGGDLFMGVEVDVCIIRGPVSFECYSAPLLFHHKITRN